MSTLLITHSHHIDPITCSFAQNLLHYPPLYRFRGPSRPQTSEYALNGASLITPCGVVVNHHMVELEAVSFDFSLGQPNPTHIPTNSHRTTQLNTYIKTIIANSQQITKHRASPPSTIKVFKLPSSFSLLYINQQIQPKFVKKKKKKIPLKNTHKNPKTLVLK